MRIVLKLGTNLLAPGDGSLDTRRIKTVVSEIAAVRKAGNEVVIVSSGAIGAGLGKLKKTNRPDSLREKQALAAIGQPLLMDTYQKLFSAHGITIAQVLLTRHDFDDRQRYLNARNTILTLLEFQAVPIINENDTIAVEEINFGDNDTLSAIVAAKICADYLVLLTDVDGLYQGTPGKSELIAEVNNIKEIEHYATTVSSSGKGRGGMLSKLQAARMATSAGVKVVIASGKRKNTLSDILKGKNPGTIFHPKKETIEARKCWIAFGTKTRGKVTIDAGAVKAVRDGKKSLLPSGVVAVEGTFKAGDSISILSQDNEEIGRGLTYFSSEDLDKIKGKKTSEIKKILNSADFNEVINRDNLAIF